jgi:plasmid stability protein
VTISLSDELLKAGREYAGRHGTSLNALMRELLERRVSMSKRARLEAFFEAVDKAPGHSRGWKWNREEIQRYG